jgi:hypothetical protein
VDVLPDVSEVRASVPLDVAGLKARH